MAGKPPSASAQPTPKVTFAKPDLGDALKNPALIGIFVAIIVVLLTIVFFWTRKRSKGRSVVFVGSLESGKTTLFTKLICGETKSTVTSIVPNEQEYQPRNGKATLTLKDLPGHDRVRVKWWDTHKAGLRAIVCVLDASGGNKAVRETADVLYNVLMDPLVNSVQPNILIFANKQDLPTAKAARIIKTQLEREITTLRLTKSATLQTTAGAGTSSKTLGHMDRDFEFDHVSPIKVEFAEGSATGAEEKELKAVLNWLDVIA